MNAFLQRHAGSVTGVLSGFDRIRFRGTIRLLANASGLSAVLSYLGVLLKDFKEYAMGLSEQLKAASLGMAERAGRPVRYLASSLVCKEDVARRIAREDGIDGGLICVLTAVEPCWSFHVRRDPQAKELVLESAWRKSIAVFNGEGSESQLELFASDAPVVPSGERVVQVLLGGVRWERPRDFGEVFLARHLWQLLGLDELLEARMERGSERIPWPLMAFILTAARLIAPSSELAIEERFYPRTALEDICGVSEEQVNKDRLYRALDRLLPHKAALEAHLKSRIGTLFDEPFDILLYDLTSTYFEGLGEGNPQARRGYSRDHRPDCVQVVIGLVVTRSGLPLGYEVFAGNQAESPTLEEMMAKMEALYGKASRIWVFDRGVASERNLEALRRAGGLYLVGTPRTLLRKVEAQLLEENWTTVREGIEVKRVA